MSPLSFGSVEAWLITSTNWDVLLGTHMSREEAESRVSAKSKAAKLE